MITIIKAMNEHRQLRWIAKAASTDATRQGIYQTIRVADGYAEATDGHRLHRVMVPTDYILADGLWAIVKNTASEIVLNEAPAGLQFPPTSQVIESCTNQTELDIDGLEFCGVLAKIIKGLEDNLGVNPDYVFDAIDVQGKRFHTFKTAHVGTERQPILIKGFDRVALIMPVKVH